MRTDAELEAEVSAELNWHPAIDAAPVGVAVDRGVVTLSGHVEFHAEKHANERAVRRVQGVRPVAVELDVKIAAGHRRRRARRAGRGSPAFTTGSAGA